MTASALGNSDGIQLQSHSALVIGAAQVIEKNGSGQVIAVSGQEVFRPWP